MLEIRPLIVTLGEEPPKRLPVTKVKEYVCATSCPIPQQCALGRGNSPLGRRRVERSPVRPRSRELSCISLSPHSIHHPNQALVIGLTRSTLIKSDVRVLELNHPTLMGLHVCDVSFTVLGMVDDLLPISGKVVLPSAVATPFHFPTTDRKADGLCEPNAGLGLLRTLQPSVFRSKYTRLKDWAELLGAVRLRAQISCLDSALTPNVK